MAFIDKEMAVKIAHKLGSIVSKKGKAHEIHEVIHEGRVVAHFGIRRGSSKSAGHGHIPNQIHLTPHDTRLFGECRITREEWIVRLTEKGLI